MCLDIEVVRIEGELKPFLICASNGYKNIVSFGSYLNRKIKHGTLFSDFFKMLASFNTGKSRRLIVYAHNLSGFDGILTYTHLVTVGCEASNTNYSLTPPPPGPLLA